MKNRDKLYRLVSILIPVFNREKYIQQTVYSALNQTYKNIEIIVVDNNSTDNTWKILQRLAKQDSRLRIFRNRKNIGPVRNWKKCIELARGTYGKILWSDDLIAPNFIEETIKYLEDENIGFVFSGSKIFNDSTDEERYHGFIGKSGIYNSEDYIHGVLLFKDFPVSPGCALFRLEDLKNNLIIDIPNKIGIDFSKHAIGNDLLIYLLTAHKYKKFAFVNKPLSYFRAHPHSITINTDKVKLTLLYSLAISYFVENYRPDLIKMNNSRLYFLLKIFKREIAKYNIKSICDFYNKNKNSNIDVIALFKIIKNIAIRKIRAFF